MNHILNILKEGSEEDFNRTFINATPNDRYETFFASTHLSLELFTRVLNKMSHRMNLVELFIVHCSDCYDSVKFNMVISHSNHPTGEKEWNLAFNKYESHAYLSKCLILHDKTPRDIIDLAVKHPKIFISLKTDEDYKTKFFDEIMNNYNVFGEKNGETENISNEKIDELKNDILDSKVQEVVSKTVCTLL